MAELNPDDLELNPAVRRAVIRIVDERIMERHITREDFSELKEIVRSLGDTMGELAEAQKESRKDINRLEKTMGELAEAQKESRKDINRLEKTMGELAEAQKNTQEELRQLVVDHRETRRHLGGLTMAVGYGIEDRLIPYIFDFGRVEYGIEVESVGREHLPHPEDGYLEVNILARGTRSGKPVYLVGECKSQPGKKDLRRFHRQSERIREALDGEVLFFLVGYILDPSVIHYAQEHCPHIRLFKTYEFELRYRKFTPPAPAPYQGPTPEPPGTSG